MKDHGVYLFDFDGTLVDSLASLYPTFRYAFSAIGIEGLSDEEIEGFTHHNLTEVMEQKKMPSELRPLFVAKIIEALDLPKLIKLILPFPEVFSTLERLHEKGKRMAVVSNNTSQHIALTLRLLGFPDVFETIVGSERLAHAKPAPDGIFLALKKMKIDHRSAAVYVGDSLQDQETAKRAGIAAIIVDRQGRYQAVGGEKISSLGDLLV